jgi:hypothetical protein
MIAGMELFIAISTGILKFIFIFSILVILNGSSVEKNNVPPVGKIKLLA